MAGDTSVGRSRRLLTFRLDGDQRRRLKARLAGEGRTMSEVVILGLQNYVAHGTRRSGSGSGSREPEAAPDAPAAPDVDAAPDAPAAAPDLVAAPDAPPAAPEPDAAAGPLSVPGLEETPDAPAAPEPDAAAGPLSVPGLEETPGAPAAPEPDAAAGPLSVPGLEETPDAPAAPEPTSRPRGPVLPAGAPTAPGTTPPGTTVVASVSQLTLPAPTAAYLRNLRKSGDSDLLSATLARLHEVGWPLRPLADALGISRQAVQARIRQSVPSPVRSRVSDVPPPSAFPRRRPALASGRRAHLTVKIDHALRSAAHGKAVREGSSLSQVIEKILDYYVRHGLPTGEVRLGDTTPTRPGPRRKRRTRGAEPPSD